MEVRLLPPDLQPTHQTLPGIILGFLSQYLQCCQHCSCHQLILEVKLLEKAA